MKKQTPKQAAKQAVKPMREEYQVDMMKELSEALLRTCGCALTEATEKQVYRALCTVVRASER